jgi:hypothetical protein
VRRFPATLDDLAKTITFVVCIVLVIPFFVIFNQYRQLHQPLLLLGPAIVIIGLIITALYRPKEYLLDTSGLRIVRPAKTLIIPLHSINSIMPMTSKELGGGVRAFGSGGFLGYFGKFWYRSHGYVTLYATDRSKMLLITLTNDRKIIISPDDPSEFLAAFNEMKRK